MTVEDPLQGVELRDLSRLPHVEAPASEPTGGAGVGWPDEARDHPRQGIVRGDCYGPRKSKIPVRRCYAGLVILFGLIVIAPLLQPGYFWGAHDARHDVYFIFEYDKSVQDGIWFPRWSPDFAFGYGYPFFIVYGPLATFVGELFHHFGGLGYEASVKAVLALSILLSGLAMYGFVRSWLGRSAGLVAAVAYMTVPYHLVDTYVRAALAESVALVFLPLALWGFRETVLRPRLSAILGSAAAYAAIMWTSNLVAVVFTPGLLVYVVVLWLWKSRTDAHAGAGATADENVTQAAGLRRPHQRQSGGLRYRGIFRTDFHAGRGATADENGRADAIRPYKSGIFRTVSPLPPLIATAAAFVFGLGLSAAFFVPALVEQRYINQTQWFGAYYNPLQHFVYFHQLFNPGWGFGISRPGPDDVAQGSLSFQLGAVPTVLALISLAMAGRLAPDRRRELWLWGIWAAASIFLTLSISTLAWRHVPLIPYAQFPWRYLMLAILPLSILPAALVTDPQYPNTQYPNPQYRTSWAPALLLATFLLLGSFPYLKVEMRPPTPEQGPVSYAALMRFQRTSNEMTGVTAWVDPEHIPAWSPLADEWVAGRDVTTRVDYSLVPQNRTLAVNAEGMSSAAEEVWYHADGPGQAITFNRFWYPGWNAYLLDGKHGRPVQRLVVEREDGPLARVVIPVPAGEGYILLRFEDTPLRAAARWITLGTAGVIVLMVAVRLITCRARSEVSSQ